MATDPVAAVRAASQGLGRFRGAGEDDAGLPGWGGLGPIANSATSGGRFYGVAPSSGPRPEVVVSPAGKALTFQQANAVLKAELAKAHATLQRETVAKSKLAATVQAAAKTIAAMKAELARLRALMGAKATPAKPVAVKPAIARATKAVAIAKANPTPLAVQTAVAKVDAAKRAAAVKLADAQRVAAQKRAKAAADAQAKKAALVKAAAAKR